MDKHVFRIRISTELLGSDSGLWELKQPRPGHLCSVGHPNRQVRMKIRERRFIQCGQTGEQESRGLVTYLSTSQVDLQDPKMGFDLNRDHEGYIPHSPETEAVLLIGYLSLGAAVSPGRCQDLVRPLPRRNVSPLDGIQLFIFPFSIFFS